MLSDTGQNPGFADEVFLIWDIGPTGNRVSPVSGMFGAPFLWKNWKITRPRRNAIFLFAAARYRHLLTTCNCLSFLSCFSRSSVPASRSAFCISATPRKRGLSVAPIHWSSSPPPLPIRLFPLTAKFVEFPPQSSDFTTSCSRCVAGRVAPRRTCSSSHLLSRISKKFTSNRVGMFGGNSQMEYDNNKRERPNNDYLVE